MLGPEPAGRGPVNGSILVQSWGCRARVSSIQPLFWPVAAASTHAALLLCARVHSETRRWLSQLSQTAQRCCPCQLPLSCLAQQSLSSCATLREMSVAIGWLKYVQRCQPNVWPSPSLRWAQAAPPVARASCGSCGRAAACRLLSKCNWSPTTPSFCMLCLAAHMASGLR